MLANVDILWGKPGGGKHLWSRFRRREARSSGGKVLPLIEEAGTGVSHQGGLLRSPESDAIRAATELQDPTPGFNYLHKEGERNEPRAGFSGGGRCRHEKCKTVRGRLAPFPPAARRAAESEVQADREEKTPGG